MIETRDSLIPLIVNNLEEASSIYKNYVGIFWMSLQITNNIRFDTVRFIQKSSLIGLIKISKA